MSQTIFGYEFRNGALLEEALTTPSCRQTDPTARDNQRLEFLGDAVLGVLAADLLYASRPRDSEGQLTVRRANMVSAPALCAAAAKHDLASRLRRNKGAAPIPANSKTLADAVEAVIGAAYLDGGLAAAKTVFDALALADLARRKVQPILVGGSGLYCDAVLEDMGYALPVDAALRKRLEAEYDADPQAFFTQMSMDDRPSGQKLHPNDKKRVVRAREVFLLSGRPFSSFNREYLAAQRHDRYPAVRVGLAMPRKKLYDAIDRRVDRMMAEGLLDEVKGLQAKGYSRQLPAMQAIGYAQLLAYLEREVPLEKAVEDIKRATRQFAKRQLTWFRRDERICWFDCEDYEEAYREIERYVKETVLHE